jgi:hypothetical protein
MTRCEAPKSCRNSATGLTRRLEWLPAGEARQPTGASRRHPCDSSRSHWRAVDSQADRANRDGSVLDRAPKRRRSPIARRGLIRRRRGVSRSVMSVLRAVQRVVAVHVSTGGADRQEGGSPADASCGCATQMGSRFVSAARRPVVGAAGVRTRRADPRRCAVWAASRPRRPARLDRRAQRLAGRDSACRRDGVVGPTGPRGGRRASGG